MQGPANNRPELRNRIYEMAFEHASRIFPTSSFHKEHQPGRRSTGRPRAYNLPTIPYMGLVQSCRQIRTEFYSSWLETHRIPLGNTSRYLKTFFPARPRSDVEYHSSRSRLRIYVCQGELHNRDLYPLIKHARQFPNRGVTVISDPTLDYPRMLDLMHLFRNRNPEWSRWIQGM